MVEALFASADVFVGGFVLTRLIYSAKFVHRMLGELFFNNSAFSAGAQQSLSYSIESSLIFLRANIDRSLSLAEMAAHAGLSESHFAHLQGADGATPRSTTLSCSRCSTPARCSP